MIEIGQKLFSLKRMADKGAQGNENGLSGLGRTLVLSTISPRHRPHRLGWAPRLNGLLTPTGQRHLGKKKGRRRRKSRLVAGVTFRCHPNNWISETCTRTHHPLPTPTPVPSCRQFRHVLWFAPYLSQGESKASSSIVSLQDLASAFD